MHYLIIRRRLSNDGFCTPVEDSVELFAANDECAKRKVKQLIVEEINSEINSVVKKDEKNIKKMKGVLFSIFFKKTTLLRYISLK